MDNTQSFPVNSPSPSFQPQELPFLLIIEFMIFVPTFFFHSLLPCIPVLFPFFYSHLSLTKGWSKVGVVRLLLGICLSIFFTWLVQCWYWSGHFISCSFIISWARLSECFYFFLPMYPASTSEAKDLFCFFSPK